MKTYANPRNTHSHFMIYLMTTILTLGLVVSTNTQAGIKTTIAGYMVKKAIEVVMSDKAEIIKQKAKDKLITYLDKNPQHVESVKSYIKAQVAKLENTEQARKLKETLQTEEYRMAIESGKKLLEELEEHFPPLTSIPFEKHLL